MTTTTHDAVQAIANHLADAEKRDRKNIVGGRRLKDDFQAISDNGNAPVLTTSSLFLELDALNTRQAAERLAFHRKITDKALELGIDVPPTEDDDGEDGGVAVMGGGDR